MDGKKFIEVMKIEDTKIRTDRVLKEVLPFLKEVAEDFMEQYQDRYPELKELKLHTHEGTLKAARAAAGNENYPESRRDSKVGEATFVVFHNKEGYEVFRIRLIGDEEVMGLGVESGFYEMHHIYQDGILQPIVKNMDDSIKFFTYYYGSDRKIAKDEMISTLEGHVKNKNVPAFFVGMEPTLNKEYTKEEVLELISEAWEKMKPLSDAVLQERKKADRVAAFKEVFNAAQGEYPFEFKDKTYKLIINEVNKYKSGRFAQLFSLYENQQMFLKGNILFDLTKAGRAYERLIIHVEGRMQIYKNLRELVLGENIDWVFKKGFAQEKANNMETKDAAFSRLSEEGIKVIDEDKYYIGKFLASKKSFDEPTEEVMKRLIKAAVIFAEVKGEIKIENEEPPIDELGIDEEEKEEIEVPDWDFDFQKILEIFNDSELSFSKDIIRDLHLNLTALDEKHFVVLSGISGTGKTQLAGLYANSVYGRGDREENPYLKVIPVRPDWMDATPLFGYYSVYEKRYIQPEFLEFLLSALDNPRKPHFVLLDEMNLARVEYYLSDYLSAVESGNKIRLHDEEELNVPKEVRIPPNLYMIGTINVDETTHSISDKVLDRAFVMHLSEVDFDMYWEKEDGAIKKELEEEFESLRKIHKILQPMDLHFGYRVINEMLRKLYRNKRLGEEAMGMKEAMDKVVAEKILPKIRGDEKILPLLSEFLNWSKVNLSETGKTVKHLERMHEELERYGTTQFWG